ncbi:MAG: hypothetical protein IH948_05985 [Bacteroidetes bacterium]|nr:hypothetical protein [Bacteroidota bacterium]
METQMQAGFDERDFAKEDYLGIIPISLYPEFEKDQMVMNNASLLEEKIFVTS